MKNRQGEKVVKSKLVSKNQLRFKVLAAMHLEFHNFLHPVYFTWGYTFSQLGCLFYMKILLFLLF